MKINIYLTCISIISFNVLANDSQKWIYPNGDIVPIEVVNEITTHCKIEDAMNKLANVKNDNFDQAFAELLKAEDCIKNKGMMLRTNKKQ